MKIPFNRIHLTQRELEYTEDVINRKSIGADGKYGKLCEKLIQDNLAADAALLTSSCTAALEMMALLLDLKEDDEVIFPSYTFVSTVNAFVLRGAKPVFCDVDPKTMNVTKETIQVCITEKTRAVVVVHYGGVACDIGNIQSLCVAENVVLLEDAAQAYGVKYEGKAVGSFGAMSCFSFHESKNITSGEGGCLIINNKQYLDKAYMIREKGTNRKQFIDGQVDKYTWCTLGSSYVLSDLNAAFLYAQLQAAEEINAARYRIWSQYQKFFETMTKYLAIELLELDYESSHNGHLFYLIMPDKKSRDKMIAFFARSGIQLAFHYVPLHTTKIANQLNSEIKSLPITESYAERLVRFPLYVDMEEHLDTILSTFKQFMSKHIALFRQTGDELKALSIG